MDSSNKDLDEKWKESTCQSTLSSGEFSYSGSLEDELQGKQIKEIRISSTHFRLIIGLFILWIFSSCALIFYFYLKDSFMTKYSCIDRLQETELKASQLQQLNISIAQTNTYLRSRVEVFEDLLGTAKKNRVGGGK